MSYLVFARKWRPLTFEDVVGQEHITNTLKKAIEKDRVAHAYIFTGTRGVGKTTSARILARALNCEKGPTPNPCGECTSCKNIINGSSFDVLEIDGASNNSVDDIRELRETIGYSSMGGSYRIFVIDEVHMLSKSAFNALLKTLEEPPKNVIFIFATTEPQKIPQTIHSRCQRYDFRRIGAEQILDRLAHICTEEKITFERSALMLVARKADGSMRDSLSLLDQVYSFCQDNLTEKEVRSVLGLVGMEIYETIMNAIVIKDSSPVLKAVQEVLHQGFDLHEFIMGLQEHLRNLLFARIPGALESNGIDMDAEHAKALADQAKSFSEGDLLRMTEIVRKTESDLKWSAYPRFLIEVMLLKLVFMDNTLSIEKLLQLAGKTDIEIPQLSEESDAKKKTELIESVPTSPAPTPTPIAPVFTEEKEAIVPIVSAPVLYSTAVKEPEVLIEDEESTVAEDQIEESDTPAGETFEDSKTELSLETVRNRWPDFLDLLMRDRPNLGTFLSLGYVAGCTSSTVDLRFSSTNGFQYREVTKTSNRDEISKLLLSYYKIALELRISLENVKIEMPGQNYANLAPTIDDEIAKEPVIQDVLEIFDGEIIS